MSLDKSGLKREKDNIRGPKLREGAPGSGGASSADSPERGPAVTLAAGWPSVAAETTQGRCAGPRMWYARPANEQPSRAELTELSCAAQRWPGGADPIRAELRRQPSWPAVLPLFACDYVAVNWQGHAGRSTAAAVARPIRKLCKRRNSGYKKIDDFVHAPDFGPI